ncbi:transglycosylase domain-containing protein [Clostridium sp. AF32-12BH]|uniref:transglycosylase domain-containing protein n=1 Tax=Clostridium sp. AF32-12BH TaxID=2292006 RepID=UPI000E4E25A3|nr:transglycosylase domain-containing protein [Clostridium sp. AF32-12BH]RHP46046.1 penicillin-binding protein [Clostridium sp. AF32-12BH]
MKSNHTPKSLAGAVPDFFVSLFGILGWLLQSILHLLTCGLILCGIIGLLIYAKVRPQLDHCREVAYDKLAQMQRQDFSMLSDTEIYDKNDQLIGLINAGHYEYVPISQISMNLQNAYIAQEDRRFKSHTGVDWIATFRAGLALIKNRGEITQGGSTITQQVVKNTYLTQEQSFTRKIVEILLAPEIEKKYSKADIMEFYCNTNFYGNHCYGVEAASRYYFGKDASDLDPYEAAVLVGISNSPTAYNPVRNPEASLEKRNDVLHSMLEVGYLTEDAYNSAISQPLNIVQEEGEGSNENYMSSYAIHCAALALMKLEDFPFQYTFKDKSDYDSYIENYQATYTEKADDIRAGGYRIYTTLDQDLQQTLQTQLDDVLSPYTELQDNGKYALQGAGVIVDNQTDCVAAIVGGRGTTDAYNRAYLSARQPGSTIKPLIDYGPAFDTGEYYPARLVDDHKFEGGPSNSGGSYYGNVSVREALNRSLNTVAWQILTDISVDYGLNYLGEMEFQKLTYIDNGVPSLSIGGFTNGVRVVDMAKGYSTLANGGIYNDQTCIRKIDHEHNGELTKNLKPHTQVVYQQDSAYMLTDVLKGTLNEPYGTGYGLALESGMPAAGKTGTTNSSKDTWFCGYTRYYTTAVWVGYDTPRAMPGIYGKTYAGKIWKQVMDQIHEGKELLDWEQPATVEMTTDPKSGITDLFSSTLSERAQQSLHDKEQRKLETDLENAVTAFEDKTIETVEDTYWVKEQYQSIISKLNLMDGSEKRTELLERMTRRNEEFTPIINDMKDTIALYEIQKAKEKAEAQKKAEEEAVTTRKNLEIQTRKNTFLSALRDVENLEYQSEDAEDIVQNAIDKLSLVESYEEAASYKERLQKAIDRIATLPTESEWEAEQAKKEEAEAAVQAANEQKIGLEQQSLRNYLSQASRSWTTWSSQMTDNAGPGIDHNSGTSSVPGSGTTTAPGSGSSQAAVTTAPTGGGN